MKRRLTDVLPPNFSWQFGQNSHVLPICGRMWENYRCVLSRGPDCMSTVGTWETSHVYVERAGTEDEPTGRPGRLNLQQLVARVRTRIRAATDHTIFTQEGFHKLCH